jgi:serine/threonine protein kinase
MGVVFYEMLHGRTPWNGVDIEDLKKNIITRPLEFKANLNPGIRGVMERMLKVDRQHRISWDELYQQGLFA